MILNPSDTIGSIPPLHCLQGCVHSPVRTASAAALADALQATRHRTLGLMQAWHEAMPDLQVPEQGGFNPPLWEWGHIAWFQEWWTLRNPQRHLGHRSTSLPSSFGPSILAQADAHYNSSEVAHDTRWALPLPPLAHTQDYLAHVLSLSLNALHQVAQHATDPSDDDLYAWRLAVQHEAMHNEASVLMAQALGVPLPPEWRHGRADSSVSVPRPDGARPSSQPATLHVPAQSWMLGHHGPGFAFDNECQAHPVDLPAFHIDAHAVTWAQYLPFVQATGHALPAHVRFHPHTGWSQQQGGTWQPLEPHEPAMHLSAHDAQAWCAWAGRRLPTEAEWECAAHQPTFMWGDVWEWTASDFAPYPGFLVHPYQEYSAPWWHDHRVLRGASHATSSTMIDVRFRNFYTPHRCDLFAGFRSVARSP